MAHRPCFPLPHLFPSIRTLQQASANSGFASLFEVLCCQLYKLHIHHAEVL